MSGINQKEYLKKYLNIGKHSSDKKKKKRKKLKVDNNRFKIIDDDVDIFENAVQEDLETEDAPQIVAIIDDRPTSLRFDEKTNTNLWIPIGGNENSTETTFDSIAEMPEAYVKKEVGTSPSRIYGHNMERGHSDKGYSASKNIIVKEEINSPGRDSNANKSPLRFSNNDDVRSPLRKPSRKNEDMSPPRRNRRDDRKCVLPIRDDDDMSPPRKCVNMDGDLSPPRKQSRKDEDISPPRRNKRDEHMSRLTDDVLPHKGNQDLSPPRKTNRNNQDMSPPRKSSRRDENISPRRKYSELDKDNLDKRKKSRWSEDNAQSSKMAKTLDGKTAGLQNAKELVEETREIRKKEEELFKNMSSEISGANASTILRDKKTGRIRNLEEEAARKLEKQKREDQNKEKYSRWGRGLKQVEDMSAKRAAELNEMSKPLARYADDEDLEQYLKEQEREGDPMLAYMRKKRKKQDIEEGKPMKPVYMGEFMPNRFGIRPGHRWDGVDRSNGYEKRWFDVQNSKLASQDESYKWSTEDM